MTMPTHIVAVGGVVENKQGEILLVKTVHGGWVFPGGQVEAGENLIDACCREIMEESGIEVTVDQLIGVYSNTSQYIWHDGVTEIPTKVMLDYVCTYVSGECTTSNETTEVEWVRKDEVLDRITSQAIRTRYQAYLDFQGSVQYMEYKTKPEFQLKLSRTI
ncbi:NUDIX hydrolase [Paenibacillus sp. 1001270B_150601_E10]|uniref:NUDIX hydrolase n=1 Tax=Paenibacillus sp. 1001270B_150601_E10 TaxID=2787079 RepID=UPI0018A04C1F|nr:NUDIX hydrolase [Paenibacillus sp. 1001270B_150601_E10]